MPLYHSPFEAFKIKADIGKTAETKLDLESKEPKQFGATFKATHPKTHFDCGFTSCTTILFLYVAFSSSLLLFFAVLSHSFLLIGCGRLQSCIMSAQAVCESRAGRQVGHPVNLLGVSEL